MNPKKVFSLFSLISWISPLALVTTMVGLGAVTAVPAVSEALEVGSQETQESPANKDHHWRGRDGRGHGPRGGMGFKRMFRELDLTQEQKDSIHEGMEGHRELFKDAHEQLLAAKRALQEASLRGEDESLLQQYAEAVGKAEAHSALLRARQFAAVIKLLDSDQRAKLEELHAEAEQRHEEYKEHREQFREERRQHKQDKEL